MIRRVSLFATCLVDLFFPEVGDSVVEVLRRAGVDVEFPRDQTCCGQPAFNAGYVDEARRVATKWLRDFEGAEAVVVPSGSCATMVRRFYGQLFADDLSRHAAAEAMAGRVFEFSQFLVDIAKVEDVGAELRERVTVHDGCHALRELGIRDQPRRLLRRVRGLELVEMKGADRCCGFGGTFAIEFGGISAAMVDDKIAAIHATGATSVVSTDCSCLMHVRGRLQRIDSSVRCRHVAEVLASGAR